MTDDIEETGAFTPQPPPDEDTGHGRSWRHRGGTAGASYGDLLAMRKAEVEDRELGRKTLKEWLGRTR